ncbi:MAG: hypothetical protein ACOCXG_05510 [Nanoarchaeota archaeon]
MLKRTFLEFIFWTWCLPQSLLGLLLIFLVLTNIFVGTNIHKKVTLIIVKKRFFLAGLSLGKYIFINESRFNQKLIKHEYGHTIQNYILGPFYLPVLILPSI